jgi:pyruvate,water dikinase
MDCQPIIWDNSSTLESYSGITLPLTFSFVREAYSVIYKQAAQMAGVSRKTISDNGHIFENMIGHIRGHMYYSLNSMYQTLSLLPGFAYSKRFMEHLGVKESGQLIPGDRHRSWIRIWMDLPRFFWMLVHMLYYALKGDSLASSLEERTNAICSEHENRLRTMRELPEFIVAFRDAAQKVLGDWKATIVNDFLVAMFFGLLRRLTAALETDGSDNLTNDLLRGQSGMLSTEPVKSIVLMADTIRNDPSLCDLFALTIDEELCRQLLDESVSGQIGIQFRQHLDRYGYRCVNELKFEELTLRDNPKALLAMIRSYVARPSLDFATIQAREEDTRQRAEELVRSRLGARFLFFPNPKFLFFRWVLRNTRRLSRHRDNMRFARARVFSLFRDIFSAMGKKMREAGFLDNDGDIFYLELSDIVAYTTGVLSGADLLQLARRRKQAFQHYREEEPPPDRFNTADLLAGSEGCSPEKARTVSGNESRELRGKGCSAGFAKGPARIVDSASEDGLKPGDILVAREMDPGWITLFPLASGILIERGSTLSHCAIVARELGVPTIVGIEGLTGRVRSGQWLTMDGAKGIVTVDKVAEG